MISQKTVIGGCKTR